MKDHIIIERPGRSAMWAVIASVLVSTGIWFTIGYFARPVIEAWLR